MIVRQEDRRETKLDSMSIEVINCSFYIAISNSNLPNWKHTVKSLLHYFDSEFSRFKTNNELWRFNEAEKDATMTASPLLYDLLKKAEAYRIKTEGRFSPYMLTQLEQHGYHQSFPFTAATSAKVHPSIYKLEAEPLIFHEAGLITKKTNQNIDLGGIAKGYVVEAVSKWLQQHAYASFGIVDGGGDMAMWSNGEKTWKIGVMDPFEEDREIGSFSIRNGGIATSNTVYRSWLQDGILKSHLLDGRTGLPVQSRIVQATVITEHCLDAEIGAKMCFMDDPTAVKTILNKLNENYHYVLVTADRQALSGRSEKNEP